MNPKLRRLVRYGGAMATVAAALLLRAAVELGTGEPLAPFMVFYPAVMAVALLGGLGPGLLATLLSAAAVGYFATPMEARVVNEAGLLIFAGIGVFISLVAHYYRRASQKAAAYDRDQAVRAGKERVEAELRESRENLLRSQEVGQIGWWRLDTRRNVLTWSEENYRIFGVPPETPLTYETFLGVIHPDDRQYVNTRWNAALQGEPYDIEHRLVVHGQVKWVREKAYLEFLQGTLLGGFGITQDITVRKNVEEQLRRSEAQLQASNRSLQDSRRAALNLTEDAVLARRQAEQATAAMQQLADRLKIFAEATFEGIALSREGRILDCNEQLAQMLQIPADALKGRHIGEFIAPEDRRRVEENIRTGRDSVTEHEMVRPDGSRITVEAHGQPGGLGLRHTAIRDITGRKQREELLKKLNRTLRALKESSQAMLRASTEQQYLADVCRILKEDCGHAMAWIGLVSEAQPASLTTTAYAGLAEADLGSFSTSEIILGSVRTGKPAVYRNIPAHPAHATLREEARRLGYCSALAVPLLEESSGISPRLPRRAFGAVAIYSQLSDAFTEDEVALLLQLAEDVAYCIRVLRLRQARVRAERRTQLLADTAAKLLVTESPQHVVEQLCHKVLEFLNCQLFFNYLVDDSEDAASARLRLNACAGIPAVEAESIRWLEFGTAVCGCAAREAQRIVAEDIQNSDDPMTRLVKSMGVQAYACHPLMAGTQVLGTLSFGTRNRPRFSPEELDLMRAVADLVAIAMERRRAQTALQATARELKRSNVDLEQFAYVASHDLQEPLRAVGGYVKLLERRLGARMDEKGREYVAGAVEGAMRMERLINDLLSFSRVGTRGEKFVPVDLGMPLQQALLNLRSSLASIGGSVTHDALPTVTGDATQLMQVFQNLISNAIKFRGNEPPRIHVSAVQQNGCWVVSVRDNGIGIEPQYYERIFQLFQRLHTRTQYPGTGIGLALCKRIVERHGGTIWVQSQFGQGSTFSFSFPDARVSG